MEKITEFKNIITDPYAYCRKYKEETGKKLLVIPAPTLRKKLSMPQGRFLSGFSAQMKGFIWPTPICNHTVALWFGAYWKRGFPEGWISWTVLLSRTHAIPSSGSLISGGLTLLISFI